MFLFIFVLNIIDYECIFNCGLKIIFHCFIWKHYFGRETNLHRKRSSILKSGVLPTKQKSRFWKDGCLSDRKRKHKWYANFGGCFSEAHRLLHAMVFICLSPEYTLFTNRRSPHSLFPTSELPLVSSVASVRLVAKNF